MQNEVRRCGEPVFRQIGGRPDDSHAQICLTCLYPGVVESALASTISEQVVRERMQSYRRMAIQPAAVGRVIQFTIEQPDDVDVNEIVVRRLATQV